MTNQEESRYIQTYISVSPNDRKTMHDLADKYSKESLELLDKAETYLDQKADLKYNQTKLSSLQKRGGSRVDLEISRCNEEIGTLTKQISDFETAYHIENEENTVDNVVPQNENDQELRQAFRVDQNQLSDQTYEKFVTELEILKDSGLVK
jgi:hypothetical protein